MPVIVKPIRIIIVDDHPLFVDGIKLLLKGEKSVEIIGEAKDGVECLELVNKVNPDVLLLDFHIPKLNGAEVTRKLKEDNNTVKVLALSADDDTKAIQEMMNSGASGYLLKSAQRKEIMDAVAKVFKGGKYLHQNILLRALDNMQSKNDAANDGNNNNGHVKKFADREMSILRLIGNELSVKEIAMELGISAVTVVTHKKSMMLKANVRNIAGLLKFAYDNKLIDSAKQS